MIPTEYQQSALATIDAYLRDLKTWKDRYDQADPVLRSSVDFPKAAWGQQRLSSSYDSKRTGHGEPLPNFCIKVPTGGGKTYLAVQTIDRVNVLYRGRQTGLVLWIVPTTQIYAQTLGYLKDRAHPYRQSLEIASGGRVKVLERKELLTLRDTEESLVVLMLMLPAAGRQQKETLRMFRDAGYVSFFPDDDDRAGHERYLKQWPNLDYFGEESDLLGRQVKTSLGNALRIVEPLVILDETQKAYSDTAQSTIRGFNPCMVVELSATPPRRSNVLVNIRGRELDREGMIKLDLNVKNSGQMDWKETLQQSVARRAELERDAVAFESKTGRYIRPICLIQVERTGKDQVDAGYIHVTHVLAELMGTHHIPRDQIAVKTADSDEITGTDLLAPDCQIRFIITKDALKEGWDCSFAYVLAILANPSSQTGLTQLVGRILRQPEAKKTGVRALDESYVFCFQRNASDILDEIKRGFEDEGLGDLSRSHVALEREDGSKESARHEILVRDKFRKFAGRVYLPQFVIAEGGHFRELSYDMDLLSRVDWRHISYDRIMKLTLQSRETVDVVERLGYDQVGDAVIEVGQEMLASSSVVNQLYLIQTLSCVVPNPWAARQILEQALAILRWRYDEATIAANQALIGEELAKMAEAECDHMCEDIFRALVAEGTLRFLLMEGTTYQVPATITVETQTQTLTVPGTGKAIQMSLFEEQPEQWFNPTLEAPVAVCLDSHEKLLFWYRNLQHHPYFYVQGWRKNRVWADFVATKKAATDPEDYDMIYVLETKGDQLAGNLDTQFKERFFTLCNELARKVSWKDITNHFPERQIRFQVVQQDEWETVVNGLFA